MDTQAYEDWILTNVDGDGYGKCDTHTSAMAKDFPELEVRKGVFHSAVWGDRQHFWLRHRETGEIVDPTANQHPDGVLFPTTAESYTDLTEATEDEIAECIPVCRCMECGEDVYRDNYVSGGFCSTGCASSFAFSLL